jgi:general secretion pathway protein G
MTRRRGRTKVFFPWERRGGLFGFVGRARARLVVGTVLGVSTLVFLYRREEHAAAVRATRASLGDTARAVRAFRADHAGACPRSVADLVTGGYSRNVPADAWGRPLRLACPGRKDPRGFDLSSDGPDGVPGGLDRIE